MKPKVKTIWFSDAVSPWRALWLTDYQRSSVIRQVPGYVQEMFFTKLIDLTQPEEAILSGFSADTRRLIRRAEKEGIVYRDTDDIDEFVRFFNKFSGQKRLSYWLNADALRKRVPEYRITNAEMNGDVLFAHLYLCDRKKSRATILYGASILKDDKRGISGAVLSSANRGLHHYDMCRFKQDGFRIYDMGGYAPDTTDDELKKINDFKDQFGGRLVQEANHRSVLLDRISAAINAAVRLKQRRGSRRAGHVPASRAG